MSAISGGPGGSAGRSAGFTPLNVVSAPAPAAPEPVVPSDVNAEIAALGERVGELIEGLSTHADAEVGTQVDELLDAIDHLHREALTRLAGLLEHHDLLVHACEDPVIGAALDLYELRPEDASTEPAAAPALIPLNAGASAPVVAATTSYPPLVMPPAMVEEVAPVEAQLVEEPAGERTYPRAVMPSPMGSGTPPEVAAPRSMVPLTELEFGRSATPSRQAVPVSAPPMSAAYTAPVVPDKDAPAEWFEIGTREQIAPGTVFSPDEGALLFSNVDGEIYAFRNGCGNGPLALHMGRVIDGRRLVCPWHIGCIYDLATGFSGEPPDQRRLMRYPVRFRDDMVEVAFNKGAVPEAPGSGASAAG